MKYPQTHTYTLLNVLNICLVFYNILSTIVKEKWHYNKPIKQPYCTLEQKIYFWLLPKMRKETV